MNSMEQSFLHSITENPSDDSYRLIYADWLEEHNQAMRAEFIRLQCEQGYKKSHVLITADGYTEDCSCQICVGRRREIELLEQCGAQWTRSIFNGFMGNYLLYLKGCVWRRGFIEEINIPCADWLEYGPNIVKCVPTMRVVYLSDKQPIGRECSEGNAEPLQMWRWVEDDSGDRISHTDPLYNRVLPESLFSYLHRKKRFVGQQPHLRWFFDTREHAIQALSEICLLYARDRLSMVVNP